MRKGRPGAAGSATLPQCSQPARLGSERERCGLQMRATIESDESDEEYNDSEASSPVKPVQRRRTRANPSPPSPPEKSPPNNPPPKDSVNPSERRLPRPAPVNLTSMDNMRDRMAAFYGNSDEELVEAIKLRAKWGNVTFTTIPSELESLDNLPNPEPVIAESLCSVTINDDNNFSGHDAVLNGERLRAQQALTNKCSVILNCGHAIISMDWNASFLAVGLAASNTKPCDMSSVTDFSKLPTIICIYDTRPLTRDGQVPPLVGSFTNLENQGAALCIRWRPNSNDLAVVLGNGVVSVLPFREETAHSYFEINRLNQNSLGEATKVAWRTTRCLVVGFKEGWLVEYDLGDANYASPSFVHRAHSSLVSSLSTGYPNHCESLFSSCVDGWSAVHDVTDLRRVKRPARVRFFSRVSTYVPLIQSYVTLEDVDTTTLVALRHPTLSQGLPVLTRHSSMVTSVAASNQHPLVVTGAQDGTINLSNAIRRTVAARRQKEIGKDVRLWQLECSHQTSEYQYVEFNRPTALKNKRTPSTIRVYPNCVSITEIQWNGTYVASGSAAGLLRFDNVST